MTPTRELIQLEDVAYDDAPVFLPALTRMLEEVEQAVAPRPEPPRHPTPASERLPRPFAYD